MGRGLHSVRALRRGTREGREIRRAVGRVAATSTRVERVDGRHIQRHAALDRRELLRRRRLPEARELEIRAVRGREDIVVERAVDCPFGPRARCKVAACRVFVPPPLAGRPNEALAYEAVTL